MDRILIQGENSIEDIMGTTDVIWTLACPC